MGSARRAWWPNGFAAGMAEALGSQAFEETQARRRRAIRAIADGLLRRAVFVAVAPGEVSGR